MCDRKKQNTQTRLGHDGWVEIYDPLPIRQGYIGDADGASEIHQATAKWKEYEDLKWTKFDRTKPWRCPKE